MTRARPFLALLLVLVTGCGTLFGDDTGASTSTTQATTTSEPPITSAPPSTTSTPSSTEAASEEPMVPFELASCESDGVFDLVCEVYEVLEREYVDPLDDEALAAGASRGIEDFAVADAAAPSDAVTCQIPTDAFQPACETAAVALSSSDPTTVAEAAVIGMLEFGLDDPNTVYLAPDAVAQLDEERSGEISGIGALVTTEEVLDDGTTELCVILTETCRMSVVGLIEDAPAERAGMQVGDVTVTVDGESILGLTSDEVVARVRGPVGTTVVLGVERDGDILEFPIERAPIVIPVTDSEILDGNIGYIGLSQFTSNSHELFRSELQTLIDGGVESIIFDLQNNPGGSLTASVRIASEFLADGLVLRTESPTDARSYEVRDGGIATNPDLELVVLVNGGSASASELVSGVLRERGRAVVLGQPSFGKNTVQQQFDVSNGGAVKVTIARWVTPDGVDFGGDGVQPDVVIEIPPDAGPDYLVDEAVAYLSG